MRSPLTKLSVPQSPSQALLSGNPAETREPNTWSVWTFSRTSSPEASLLWERLAPQETLPNRVAGALSVTESAAQADSEFNSHLCKRGLPATQRPLAPFPPGSSESRKAGRRTSSPASILHVNKKPQYYVSFSCFPEVRTKSGSGHSVTGHCQSQWQPSTSRGPVCRAFCVIVCTHIDFPVVFKTPLTPALSTQVKLVLQLKSRVFRRIIHTRSLLGREEPGAASWAETSLSHVPGAGEPG